MVEATSTTMTQGRVIMATAVALVAIGLSSGGLSTLMRPLVEKMESITLAPPDNEVGKIPFLTYPELMPEYQGKRALLIGGTRGIGYGIALAMAKAGAAQVTIVGRNPTTGENAVKSIIEESGNSNVAYLPGDIGTVSNCKDLIDRLENHVRNDDDESGDEKRRYDYLVVTAAIFPDFKNHLLNEDGIDKSFAISVVGRFIIYRNMHRFMKTKAEECRVLNVLAAGHNRPVSFDRDMVHQGSKGLFSGIQNFAIGNDIMLVGLRERDDGLAGKVTMVTTMPGLLKTDLHRGQGVLFDIFEGIMVAIMGISEEVCGIRQSSILVSKQLTPNGLSIVDEKGHGRLKGQGLDDDISNHLDWLWDLLLGLETKLKLEDPSQD